MSERLISQWRFLGDDWITAIDVVRGKYVIAGSRDGALLILTWHGVLVKKVQYENWLGAIRIVHTLQPDAQQPEALRSYIFVGNKAGVLRCLKANLGPGDRVDLMEMFQFQANNTIRDIAVLEAGSDDRSIWVAAGSEDRHIYVFQFRDLDTGKVDTNLPLSTNGWIRSVAFCRDPEGKILVAGGSGDKHLHLFDLAGTQVSNVFVDSKIHSIVTDLSSSLIYCTSDAKKLIVIGPKGENDYQIQHTTPLPHRGIKMEFASEEREQILIACEDKNIYVYDGVEQELVGRLPMRGRVTALRVASITPHVLLVGHGQRTLECVAYRHSSQPIKFVPAAYRGQIGDFDAANLRSLAELLFVGPKKARVKVGIGRFMHLVASYPDAPNVCAVATDEGNVFVIDLNLDGDDVRPIYERPRDENYRVWAVYARWRDSKNLCLYVATSESRVRIYNVCWRESVCTTTLENSIELKDWPREIRPFDVETTGDERGLVIACENGDLIFQGTSVDAVNVGQTLRTAYAYYKSNVIEVLTGSDNNRICLFRNGQEAWSYATRDRVREVLVDRGEYVAVSEDRFVYVLDSNGTLRYRYRFPHRALSVDVYQSTPEDRWLVVGCGDGVVYFVNRVGFVNDAYQFPDRIRDVKVRPSGDLVVVACEDAHVYFAPTVSEFMNHFYSDSHYEVIASRASDVERRVRSGRPEGLTVLDEFSLQEKLLLLSFFRTWLRGGNNDFFVLLLDSASRDFEKEYNLKELYAYASVLVVAAASVDFAIGRSRINDFIGMLESDSYALHALLAAVAHQEVTKIPKVGSSGGGRAVVEVVVAGLPLSDEWIREELLAKLQEAGFLTLGVGGFHRAFEVATMPYLKFDDIVMGATKCALLPVRDSDTAHFAQNIVDASENNTEVTIEMLLRGVRQIDVDLRAELTRIFDLWSRGHGLQPSDIDDASRFWLRHDEVKGLVGSNAAAVSTTRGYVDISEFGRLVELSLMRKNPQMSGREYLFCLLLTKLTQAGGTSIKK